MTEAPRKGMLDTSTVILLGEITDSSELPDESVICRKSLNYPLMKPHSWLVSDPEPLSGLSQLA